MATKTTKPPSRRPSKPAPKMDDMMTSASSNETARTAPQMSQMDREVIAKRAFELYLERGGAHGHHVEDWLRAERELTATRFSN